MLKFLIQWLVFLITNLLVAVIAAVWAIRFAKRNDILSLVAHWLTLFLGTIVFTLTLLGAIGMLSVESLILLLILICVLSLLFVSNVTENLRYLKGLVNSIASNTLSGSSLIGVVAIAGWGLFSFALTALLEPSTLVDTLVYHMPMVVKWTQRGNLMPIQVMGSDIANSYFPGNGELLYLWAFLPFENDFLVRFVSVFTWLIMGFAFYRLGLQVGSSRDSTFIVVLVSLFSPLILSQATEMTLDMTSAAVLALVLSNLFEFQDEANFGALITFSISLGVFVGIKYSGPAYALYLILSFGWFLLQEASEMPLSRLLLMFLSFGLVASFVGGYWYIRNWALTGNPIYPVQVSVLGHVLFNGSHTTHTYANTIWKSIRDIPVTVLIKSLVNGYGILVLLMLAASGIASLLYIKNNNAGYETGRDVTIRKWILVLGFFVSVLLYVRTPYSVMRFSETEPISIRHLAAGMRFSLNAMSFGAALVAVAIEYYRLRIRYLWPVIVLAVFLGIFAGSDRATYTYFGRPIVSLPRITFAVMLVLSFMVLFFLIRRSSRLISNISRNRSYFLVALILAIFLSGFIAYGVREQRERFRYPIYRNEYGEFAEGWKWLADNTDNARIAFSGSFPLAYPIYGNDFSNKVRYINVQGDIDDWHHDFFKSDGYYRTHPSFDIWLQNLRDWGADFFVISRADDYIIESTWVDKYTRIFVPMFQNAEIEIFRVRSE